MNRSLLVPTTLLLQAVLPTSGVSQAMWRLEPTLTIGSVDGPVTFGSVSGLAVEADGTILVLDRYDGTVRAFAPDGSLESAFGGRGRGPGELSELSSDLLVLPNGVIAVPDLGNRRVTVFSSDYSYSHSFRLSPSEGMAVRWAVLGDKLLKEVRPVPVLPGARAVRLSRWAVVALNPLGEELGTLLSFDGPGPAAVNRNGQVTSRVYEDRPVWGVVPGGLLAHGSSGTYEVIVANENGPALVTLSRSVRRGPVTDKIREEETRRFEKGMAGFPPSVRERMEAPTFADSLPVIGAILPGPGGTILVRRGRGLIDDYSGSGDGGQQGEPAATYDVFTVDGEYSGILAPPSDFALLAVAGNLIYGTSSDESDVETIAVYRAIPPH